MKHLIYDTAITVHAVVADADDELIVGDQVDMQGWEGVAFIAVADEGVDGETLTLGAQQGDRADGSDMAALDVAFRFDTDLNAKVQGMLDIYRPTQRYIRATLLVPDIGPATLAVSIIAVRYKGRAEPWKDLATGTLLNPGEFYLSPPLA